MRRPAPINTKREEQLCKLWNDKCPPGTPVTLRLDNGDTLDTVTRSEAWLLGHGQAVISVDGKSGGWALERVTARTA